LIAKDGNQSYKMTGNILYDVAVELTQQIGVEDME
jgi:hypothetical protein